MKLRIKLDIIEDDNSDNTLFSTDIDVTKNDLNKKATAIIKLLDNISEKFASNTNLGIWCMYDDIIYEIIHTSDNGEDYTLRPAFSIKDNCAITEDNKNNYDTFYTLNCLDLEWAYGGCSLEDAIRLCIEETAE